MSSWISQPNSLPVLISDGSLYESTEWKWPKISYSKKALFKELRLAKNKTKYTNELNTYAHTKPCVQMFIAALFIIAKKLEATKIVFQ